VKSHLEKVHSSFPVVRLAEYIVQHNEKVRIGDSPDDKFRILGVTNKVGVFHAYDAFGRDINQPYKRVSARDFSYNPYRVNVGSIGMVPPDLDKGYISPAYVVFSVASEKLIPEFLELILPSHWYNPVLRATTAGSVRQNLTYDLLGSLAIPLPPLSIQRAIVARWRAAQEAVHKANERIARIEKQTAARFLSDLGLPLPERATPRKAFAVHWEGFERWTVSYNQVAASLIDLTRGKYPVVELSSILDMVQYGTSEKANTGGNGIPVLRMNNIKDGCLDCSDLKHMTLLRKTRDALLLQDGDILFNRTNSKELVGKCAVFRESGEYVFASYLIRVRGKPDKALPDFIAYCINSVIGRQQIDALSRQIIGQANINSQELRSLRISLPPLEVQRAMMERVAAGLAEIARQREAAEGLRHRTQTEVEEMILGLRPVK
jgi:type I restriction enzyme S subunit